MSESFRQRFRRLAGYVVPFFGQTLPGAIRNHLNVAELLAVVGKAGTAGGVGAVVGAIAQNAGAIFSAQDLALATAILTAVAEAVRRLSQGNPAPAPAPQ